LEAWIAKSAQTAPCGFFLCVTFVRPYGRQWQGAFGLPVFLFAPVFQPCHLPPSRLEARTGLNAIKELVMTSIDTSTQFPNQTIKADHQPFSWLTEELRIDASMQFLAHTLDMTQGIQTCLSLIHASNQAREERDPACPPTLSISDTERLTRLAMAVAGSLSEQAERHIDALNRRYSAKSISTS